MDWPYIHTSCRGTSFLPATPGPPRFPIVCLPQTGEVGVGDARDGSHIGPPSWTRPVQMTASSCAPPRPSLTIWSGPSVAPPEATQVGGVGSGGAPQCPPGEPPWGRWGGGSAAPAHSLPRCTARALAGRGAVPGPHSARLRGRVGCWGGGAGGAEERRIPPGTRRRPRSGWRGGGGVGGERISPARWVQNHSRDGWCCVQNRGWKVGGRRRARWGAVPPAVERAPPAPLPPRAPPPLARPARLTRGLARGGGQTHPRPSSQSTWWWGGGGRGCVPNCTYCVLYCIHGEGEGGDGPPGTPPFWVWVRARGGGPGHPPP